MFGATINMGKSGSLLNGGSIFGGSGSGFGAMDGPSSLNAKAATTNTAAPVVGNAAAAAAAVGGGGPEVCATVINVPIGTNADLMMSLYQPFGAVRADIIGGDAGVAFVYFHSDAHARAASEHASRSPFRINNVELYLDYTPAAASTIGGGASSVVNGSMNGAGGSSGSLNAGLNASGGGLWSGDSQQSVGGSSLFGSDGGGLGLGLPPGFNSNPDSMFAGGLGDLNRDSSRLAGIGSSGGGGGSDKQTMEISRNEYFELRRAKEALEGVTRERDQLGQQLATLQAQMQNAKRENESLQQRLGAKSSMSSGMVNNAFSQQRGLF
jgi:hypothetical protein